MRALLEFVTRGLEPKPGKQSFRDFRIGAARTERTAKIHRIVLSEA
jgi:hypothetical protein